MKTFIYNTVSKPAKYGSNVIVSIYRLHKNKPIFLGETFYNTGSFRGIEGEINNWLISNKHLPNTYQERGGYVNYSFYGMDKKYYFYNI